MASDSTADESPAVESFLRERRAGVLNRAIKALEVCPGDGLGAEAHRLAGTLGVYGIDDAARACRTLMAVVAKESDTGIEAAREATLQLLREISRLDGQEAPG